MVSFIIMNPCSHFKMLSGKREFDLLVKFIETKEFELYEYDDEEVEDEEDDELEESKDQEKTIKDEL